MGKTLQLRKAVKCLLPCNTRNQKTKVIMNLKTYQNICVPQKRKPTKIALVRGYEEIDGSGVRGLSDF